LAAGGAVLPPAARPEVRSWFIVPVWNNTWQIFSNAAAISLIRNASRTQQIDSATEEAIGERAFRGVGHCSRWDGASGARWWR